MSRVRPDSIPDVEDTGFSRKLTREWDDEERKNPHSVAVRNAVTCAGSTFTTTDSTELARVSHIFSHSIKEPACKATNQGLSGRCWIFAGLNIFRHLFMKSLSTRNFEFSQSYLFFWDKFERAYTFLKWMIEAPEKERRFGTREYEHMLSTYRSDGGYWETFANLVEKYGLVPKSSMPETYHSSDSDDMNDILNEHLNSCIAYLMLHPKIPHAEKYAKLTETMRHIYNNLVRFIGVPPKTFDITIKDTSDNVLTLRGLTPEKLKKAIIPMELNTFHVLGNYPSAKYKYNKIYEISHMTNTTGGIPPRMLNLEIEDLKRATRKQVEAGLPVWFGCDVKRDFHFPLQSLNAKLFAKDIVFGKPLLKLTKAQRLETYMSGGTHAMAIIGFHEEGGRVTRWQVENSWGYADSDEVGLDGFLTMDDDWFTENVYEVVIHEKFLSRSNLATIERAEIIKISPWDTLATVHSRTVQPMSMKTLMRRD